jgi:glutamate dehydrogenase (NAD(P)+)
MTPAETLEVVVRSPSGDPLGAIAIDSTVAGRSRGGLRLSHRADLAEVSPLARLMTLKYGFLGLPQGGAKAAVRCDPDGSPEERRARLGAFARATAPLVRSGLYVPDADVGTRLADVLHVLACAGVRPKRREWRFDRSGFWTARSVVAALREVATRVGRPLAGATVAIEGFGAVGSALARCVVEEGGRVVAVSTSRGLVLDPAGLDVNTLRSAARAKGNQFVETWPGKRLDRTALTSLEVDYLCPCAVGQTFQEHNAMEVRARAIVPGANLPWTREAEERLHAMGVLCVPDFLANCGGVLGGTMEFAGIPDAEIVAFIDYEIAPRIGRVLDMAEDRKSPPGPMAEQVARVAHAAVKARAEHAGAGRGLMTAALELHRRGWLPRGVVGRAALQWFRDAIAEPGG